eukprot:2107403-Rhodomonas_salina.3
MVLRLRYAMSGTDVGHVLRRQYTQIEWVAGHSEVASPYRATHLLRGARYWLQCCSFATRCPVLTKGMVLPGGDRLLRAALGRRLHHSLLTLES